MGLFDNLKKKTSRKNHSPFNVDEMEDVQKKVKSIFNGDKEGMYMIAVKNGQDAAEIKGQIKGMDSIELAQVMIDFIGEYVDPSMYEHYYKRMKKKGLL